MKTTLNLLRQFGNIDGKDKEIISMIKEHIGEVDNYHSMSGDYNNIVIAEIVQKTTHPNADKLGIYELNFGSSENIQVVAGDKSLKIGDKVAYLKVGATVPSSIYTETQPFKISQVKLRGVESNGMMGSAKELNVGNNHTEVMRLPKDAPVGEEFAQYYKLKDTVVEIENKALTNRGDLFGILGISRELTAISGNSFKTPPWYHKDSKNLKAEKNCLNIKISNDAETLCSRYTAVALDNIKIKESPVWLQSILIKCGIKPINNVVDITNYISLLIGQPLHAFDFDKIVSSDPNNQDLAHIKIRTAKDGETILALDDKTYELNSKTLVIADSTHPIAIAGIIGGKDTEVDQNTKRIVLESANFDKSNIRKTSMRMGIYTESATRFKHYLSTKQTLPALHKAVEMIKELSGAKIASEIIDIYPVEEREQTVKVEIDKLNERLGTTLSRKEIKQILENLEYQVKTKKKDILYITPPAWRKDIDIPEDIYEDVGRVYGYNNIELQLPYKKITPPKTNTVFETKRILRNIFSQNGANETLTYSFVSPKSFKDSNLNTDLAYKLKNPLSPELSLMRTTILQSLLLKAKENTERGFEKFSLYELNIAHTNNSIDKNKLPNEDWYASMLITSSEKTTPLGSPFYTAKSYLDKIFEGLNVSSAEYNLISETSETKLPTSVKNLITMFDPNTSAIVSVQGIVLGVVGEFLNTVKDNHKLAKYTAGFEISVDKLSQIKGENKEYREQPIYPSFTQDLCFEVEKESKYSDLRNNVEKVLESRNLWYQINCIDIYQDEKITDKKRITFRIKASDYEKTLEDKDIKEIIENIQKQINGKLI